MSTHPIEVRLLVQHHVGRMDLWCPVFVCATCREPITDPHKAMAFWENTYTSGASAVPVTIAHKGECDPGLRSSRELVEFIEQLRHNTMEPITDWKPAA